MSLSNRRNFLLLASAPLALSACGFKPIYGEGSAAEQMHGRIALGEFSGLSGFQMREQLETRLGAATEATHVLSVDLNIGSKGLAITTDGSITRYKLSGSAKFTIRLLDGGLAAQGDVRAFTAYNATDATYATRVAEQDARRRLIVTLADKIITDMAITSEIWLW